MNKAGGKKWSSLDIYNLRNARLLDPDSSVATFSLKYAIMVDRTSGSVRSKVQELLRERRSEIPKSKYRVWGDEPIIEGDALILNDLHIPYHDANFVNLCLRLAHKWKIPTTILGGDVLEANSFSHFPEDFAPSNAVLNSNARERLESIFLNMPDGEQKDKLSAFLDEADAPQGSMNEELKEARAILKALAAATKQVFWIMGNHEARIIRVMEKTLEPKMMTSLFVGDNPNWKVSPNYWCELKSNGEVYRVTHPVNTGKGSSKRLAPKYKTHIVMAHNHHFAVQSDPSGEYLSIEAGACVDRKRLPYEMQRDNAADMHMTGAVIVRNGKPWILNKWTDWEYLLK